MLRKLLFLAFLACISGLVDNIDRVVAQRGRSDIELRRIFMSPHEQRRIGGTYRAGQWHGSD